MLRIPEDYSLNQEVLHQRYKKMQQKYHPDVSKDKDALTISSTINLAYATLKDPVQRAIYMLTVIHNQDINDASQVSTAFLEKTYHLKEVAEEGTSEEKQQAKTECQKDFDMLVEQIATSLEAQNFRTSIQQTKQLVFLQKCLDRLS